MYEYIRSLFEKAQEGERIMPSLNRASGSNSEETLPLNFMKHDRPSVTLLSKKFGKTKNGFLIWSVSRSILRLSIIERKGQALNVEKGLIAEEEAFAAA